MGLLQALGLKLEKPVTATAGDGGKAATGGGDVAVADAKDTTVGDVVQQGIFSSNRAVAAATIAALKSHPQTAAITTLIAQASTKLGIADGHAAKSEWPEATQALDDVMAICATAQKAADDRQAYTVKLASVVMASNAYEGFNAGMKGQVDAAANNARAQAAANNYVAAIATLDGITGTIKTNFQSWINSVQGSLATATATASTAALFKPELDKARTQLAAAKAAHTAGRWSECAMGALAALRFLAPLARAAPRRAAYDTARATAVTAIANVRKVAAVADRGPGLDALLAQADAAAGHANMQFEAGQGILTDIGNRAALIIAAGTDAEVYKRQRPGADAELEALDKHAAAARVTAARETARKQLAEAAKAAAGAATAADPGPGWFAASTAVVRVRADLAAAKALADGAGNAAAAEAAAAKPTDVAAMKTALKALQADQATASAAPFAADAAVQLRACKEAADKADKALAKDDGKTAAPALAKAAKSLVDAKAIQVAQGQFASTLPSVEARLTKLKALPRAALLKGVIDPVAKALAEAKAKNTAKAGVEAMAALRRATDLADAADKADLDRGKFDTAAAATTTHVATVTDPKAKKPLDAALAAAKKLADEFKFGEATAALKKVDVSVDKAALVAKAAANPADPAIATLAAQMVANGGEKEVDNLVAAGSTTDRRMIAALTSGRFGVTVVPDLAATNAAQEAKSMKALHATFAGVPKDVKAKGSITAITHTDATGAGGIGGAWSTGATVTLSGRPDLGKQGFGTALTTKAPDGKTVKQLPADIDKNCVAVADDSELLSFTALHEVGHGVDDSTAYMLRNGGADDHGGWVRHGSSVQPIADAVGPHVRAKIGGTNTFYTKAEDRKYVLDKILNQKPVRPASVAAGSDDAKAYDEFDKWHRLATSSGIYERQGDCDEITIANKTIYHQAYARDWVSYNAAARKQGLTGYQFRAPGEWFAELYAAYKSKMLKPSHPAVKWLKTL